MKKSDVVSEALKKIVAQENQKMREAIKRKC